MGISGTAGGVAGAAKLAGINPSIAVPHTVAAAAARSPRHSAGFAYLPGSTKAGPANVAKIGSSKFDYLFGNATGVKNAAHNAPRTAQNLAQMRRLGLFDDAAGRQILQRHFDGVVNDATNITRRSTNRYGTFEVRESLFAGPSGQFAKFESTWQLLPNQTRRLTTLIPFGGQ